MSARLCISRDSKALRLEAGIEWREWKSGKGGEKRIAKK